MKWLLNNFWLKVVAFAAGLLVWFHVATEKSYDFDITLPVTEIALKDQLALSKEPPDSLFVSVSATGKQLLRHEWRDRGVRINATQYQAGRYSLSLSKLNTFLVYTEDLISLDEVISPVTVPLEIDVESASSVKVVPDLDVSADEGFAIGQELVVVPPTVRLTGPRSKVGLITSLPTEPKKLGGLKNPVTMRLALIPPKGFGFHLAPDSVTVTVPVVPVKTRVYEDIPVVVFNAPPDVVVTTDPKVVRLEIIGPPDDIDLLNRNALTASVDYRRQNTENRAGIKVDCPPNFRLKRASDQSVHIQVDTNADLRN